MNAVDLSPSSGLSEAHLRRLKDVWRSAGWPYQDAMEAELLVDGWLERRWDDQQRVTVHLTDKGLQAVVGTVRRNRARLSLHEQLVSRVALAQHQEGRIVWKGLALRAGISEPADAVKPIRWVMAIPDVFSIRHTTKADFLEPVAHEVKVRRADLLSDLRQPDKARAYLEAAGQCWYVIREGIGEPDEIPQEFGVMVAGDSTLQVARAAPRRAGTLSFSTWMALAKAAPARFESQTSGLVPSEPEPEMVLRTAALQAPDGGEWDASTEAKTPPNGGVSA